MNGDRPSSSNPRKPIRIFCVDDEANDILLLQRALKAVGFTGVIEFATDGQEAIEVLEGTRTDAGPDLVLLDLKMPRRNGFECLQWLRPHDDYNSVRVAVFTTSSHPDDISKAYSLGADLFLVKPLAFEDLIQLARALGEALEDGDAGFSGVKASPAFRPRPVSEGV